jgi:lysophospholipase L1-like esterase
MKSFFKRLGDIWLIFGIILLIFVLIEVFFKFYYLFQSDEDPRLHADCYQNTEWVDEYYKEFSACNVEEWESYVYWRRKPFAGNYINVDANQRRKTFYVDDNSIKLNPDYRIFMFGGSTMWGTGVRDEYTIPSLLGSYLSRNGYHVEVINFGESGYVNTQEVIELSMQLRQKNIPNLVVFYDGVNDVFSSFQQGKAGIPQNEFNREKEFNVLNSKKRSLLVFLESLKTLASIRFINDITKSNQVAEISYTDQELKLLALETFDLYQENMHLVYSLGEESDFKSIFYWQPTVFNKRNLSEYEKERVNEMEYLKSFLKSVNNYMITEDVIHQSLYYYDISEIFYDEKEPVFIDYCHVSEYGNSVIAKRIAKDIISILGSSKEPENEKTELPSLENEGSDESL